MSPAGSHETDRRRRGLGCGRSIRTSGLGTLRRDCPALRACSDHPCFGDGECSPDTYAGVASGINNAASRLAGLIAVALVGAVAAMVFASGLEGWVGAQFGALPVSGTGEREVVAAAFASAYSAGMMVCALLAALEALTA